jgi:hypothetical protein
LPLHRKAPALIGGMLVFAGIVWFKLAFSWAGLASSALTVVAGLLLVAFAYSGIEHQKGPRNAG